MLDFDLAELYGNETKRLKEAVKRNLKRFPSDFMFELTKEEFESLRTQIATSNKRGGTRYMPFAFTEQGVAMLSSVLNSEAAIEINISIMRAFVTVRHYLSSVITFLLILFPVFQDKKRIYFLNKRKHLYLTRITPSF